MRTDPQPSPSTALKTVDHMFPAFDCKTLEKPGNLAIVIQAEKLVGSTSIDVGLKPLTILAESKLLMATAVLIGLCVLMIVYHRTFASILGRSPRYSDTSAMTGSLYSLE